MSEQIWHDEERCGTNQRAVAAERVAERFAEQRQHLLDLGWDRVAKVEMHVEPIELSPRNVAQSAFRPRKPPLVILDPQFLWLNADQREAVLRHEWGHVLDHLYAASLRGVVDGIPVLREATRSETATWKARSHDQIEWAADELALAVFGDRLRYSGRCLIQSLRHGTWPRPAGLY